jgi:hypothetical protein
MTRKGQILEEAAELDHVWGVWAEHTVVLLPAPHKGTRTANDRESGSSSQPSEKKT